MIKEKAKKHNYVSYYRGEEYRANANSILGAIEKIAEQVTAESKAEKLQKELNK